MEINPLSSLWIGKATIYEYVDSIDPDTHQSTQTEQVIVEDEPCRISYKSETTTNITTGVGEMTQFTVLFIRPDLTIKAGSVIEVTQHGITTKYRRSGTPTVYTNHQEVILTLYEDKA